MILGFTGTREGMTDRQREGVAEFLRVNKPLVVHHGDCVGADSQFHDSVLLLSNEPPRIETHPCNLPDSLRAFRKADFVHSMKSPKDRNRDIAWGCEQLLAAPRATEEESPRSGTWQTVRLARSFKKTVIIIWPDGSVTGSGYTSLAEIFGGA